MRHAAGSTSVALSMSLVENAGNYLVVGNMVLNAQKTGYSSPSILAYARYRFKYILQVSILKTWLLLSL
jgi:hypothetical protein